LVVNAKSKRKLRRRLSCNTCSARSTPPTSLRSTVLLRTHTLLSPALVHIICACPPFFSRQVAVEIDQARDFGLSKTSTIRSFAVPNDAATAPAVACLSACASQPGCVAWSVLSNNTNGTLDQCSLYNMAGENYTNISNIQCCAAEFSSEVQQSVRFTRSIFLLWFGLQLKSHLLLIRDSLSECCNVHLQ
jgi:hypothetical protein